QCAGAGNPGLSPTTPARRRLSKRRCLVPVLQFRVTGGDPVIDSQAFVNGLATEPGLAGWCDTLPEQIHRSLDVQRCGDLPRWQAALDALPDYPVSHCDLNADTVAVHSAATVATSQQAALRQTLQVLHPWRKGPFDL